MPSQFYLSATHKSSGKTLMAVGLASALSKNYSLQTFKKGLDYIDPIWLSLASGKPCFNLDFYTSTHLEIKQCFQSYSMHSELSIVEGNKGLYDGLTPAGGDSNADMAKLLNLPIILVIDCMGITRGIAPLLQGYQNFENANIIGVILNKVASSRHEIKLKSAVQTYTDLAIFGVLRRDDSLFVRERYLGLEPANEHYQAAQQVKQLGRRIRTEIDLKQIVEKTKCNTREITNSARFSINSAAKKKNEFKKIRLAVAKDKAFGFYYADDFIAFRNLGVEIIYFDTLNDRLLPKADALFIGGGFPEIYAKALAANHSLLKDIRSKIEAGLPTYAECGGLMYLTNGIQTKAQFYPMAAVIPAITQMLDRPAGRGYVQLVANKNHLWRIPKKIIYAHEFHYSMLTEITESFNYAYKVLRGSGISKQRDGIMMYKLLACYSHLHQTENNRWVYQFVSFIKAN